VDTSAPQVLSLDEIQRRVDVPRLVDEIARGFAAYSAGRAVVPPVGYLTFERPPGDVHIKYGYVVGESSYVVKIASGFPENSALGIPAGDGLMLRFDQRTGALTHILLDRAYLTDVRTAAAGAVAARYLAPAQVGRIGVLGTGVQARLQPQLLRNVTGCTSVVAWGRRRERLLAYAADMRTQGFEVEPVGSPTDVAAACNLIVTTTAAREPLLSAEAVRPGTHVTAVGADAPGKQELAPELFAKAQRVVVDSLAQCADHGELAHAIRAGTVRLEEVVELGAVVAGTAPGRRADDEITVCDLTGVAVQDIVVASHVCGAG